jgi:UDP-glucose 4-epimerase
MNHSLELAGRRVLVTGGSGFIGRHLLDRLARLGCRGSALSRTSQAPLSGDICWHRGDLADLSAARRLIRSTRPDVIFHLAGHVTGARSVDVIGPAFQSNLVSTVNLLTGATEAGCSRIILAGSQEEPLQDGPELIPCSPYAVSKWASGAYARMFHALYQLPVVILRIFMAYGPAQRDRRKLVPYTILSMLNGKVPQLMSGMRPIDWVYVDDVVEGLLASAQVPHVEGKTIDIGSGRLETVRHVVEKLTLFTGRGITPRFGAKPDRAFEQIRMADTKAAKELLGWTARVSLDEGLRRTVSWYESHATSREPDRLLRSGRGNGAAEVRDLAAEHGHPHP